MCEVKSSLCSDYFSTCIVCRRFIVKQYVHADSDYRPDKRTKTEAVSEDDRSDDGGSRATKPGTGSGGVENDMKYVTKRDVTLNQEGRYIFEYPESANYHFKTVWGGPLESLMVMVKGYTPSSGNMKYFGVLVSDKDKFTISQEPTDEGKHPEKYSKVIFVCNAPQPDTSSSAVYFY